MKKLYLVLLVILLSSCGTIQQKRQQKQFESQLRSAELYCDGLFQDSALDPIRNKIPIGKTYNPTFEMLALTEKANAEEKKSLIKLGELTDKCGSKISLVYDKNGLTNHQIIIDSYAAITKGLLVDLYNDNLTYGEYHKLRQDNVLEFRRAFSNLDEKIASQRAVAAQRAYQNYLLNKPIVCNKIGNTTLCN